MPTRVVIKVGTSSLLQPDGSGVKLVLVARLCEAVKTLRTAGHEVVIVSSGAVGMGCLKMGITSKPTDLGQLQALAAVGGMDLSKLYETVFAMTGSVCAQVLLTYSTFGSKSQLHTAKRAFDAMLAMGITPIVNENDVVSCEELQIGDNDSLAAMVSTLVNADWLILLTDVPGLFTADPTTDPRARRLASVKHEGLPEIKRRFASGETLDPTEDLRLREWVTLDGGAAPGRTLPAGPSAAAVAAAPGPGAPGPGKMHRQMALSLSSTAPKAGKGTAAGGGGVKHQVAAGSTSSEASAGDVGEDSDFVDTGTPTGDTAGSSFPVFGGGAGDKDADDLQPTVWASNNIAAAPRPAAASAGDASASSTSGAATVGKVKPAASGRWGTGGMATKLAAAQIASACGANTVIMHSADVADIPRGVLEKGFASGTTIEPSPTPATKGHKRWLTTQTAVGNLVLDAGAVDAVQRGSTLFPAGVAEVQGAFRVNDVVNLVDADGSIVAKALVDYGSDDVHAIRGLKAEDIERVLGYITVESVCRRANIAVMRRVAKYATSASEPLEASAAAATAAAVGRK